MKKTFIYLFLVVLSVGLYSCNTNNNSLSVTPVLNNNPTPVYNPYNYAGYYRVYNNGILYNFPIVATALSNDTDRVFAGNYTYGNTIPAVSLNLYNYDSMRVGYYQFIPGVNILGMGFIDDIAAYSNPTIAASKVAIDWQLNILIKTNHRFKAAFNFTRADGQVFTNGMMDITW